MPPESEIAAVHASTARRSSLRPEFDENSVEPMPTIAARPAKRCRARPAESARTSHGGYAVESPRSGGRRGCGVSRRVRPATRRNWGTLIGGGRRLTDGCRANRPRTACRYGPRRVRSRRGRRSSAGPRRAPPGRRQGVVETRRRRMVQHDERMEFLVRIPAAPVERAAPPTRHLGRELQRFAVSHCCTTSSGGPRPRRTPCRLDRRAVAVGAGRRRQRRGSSMVGHRAAWAPAVARVRQDGCR